MNNFDKNFEFEILKSEDLNSVIATFVWYWEGFNPPPPSPAPPFVQFSLFQKSG